MILKNCLLLLCGTLICYLGHSQTGKYNVENGVCVNGYDVVSYFSLKPTKGNKNLAVKHDNCVYYFSNEKNKELFIENPSKYLPQYGGWCAYAMGNDGSKVEIDPETFKIINGKLYLYYNAYFNNTLKKWNKDENNLKNKADANWKKLGY